MLGAVIQIHPSISFMVLENSRFGLARPCDDIPIDPRVRLVMIDVGQKLNGIGQPPKSTDFRIKTTLRKIDAATPAIQHFSVKAGCIFWKMGNSSYSHRDWTFSLLHHLNTQ